MRKWQHQCTAPAFCRAVAWARHALRFPPSRAGALHAGRCLRYAYVLARCCRSAMLRLAASRKPGVSQKPPVATSSIS